MKCYDFKQVSFNNENNLLDDSVDATYVIHLENNGRYDSIIEQLKFFQPTKRVFILFNKGFKNCKKESHVNSSNTDLVDSYLQIFQHSIDNGFNNNILILEDDFFFDKKILEKRICRDINNFLLENRDTEFFYYLGCIPFIQTKYSGNHNKMIVGCATHSVIYSKAIINRIIYKNDRTKIIDWDAHSRNLTRYLYKTPLCYQLFPLTENSKSWIKSSSLKVDVYFLQFLFKKLNLDKNVDGYSKLYYWSLRIFQIFIYICILLISVLIFCLILFLIRQRRIF
jgi:hypothetical protein